MFHFLKYLTVFFWNNPGTRNRIKDEPILALLQEILLTKQKSLEQATSIQDMFLFFFYFLPYDQRQHRPDYWMSLKIILWKDFSWSVGWIQMSLNFLSVQTQPSCGNVWHFHCRYQQSLNGRGLYAGICSIFAIRDDQSMILTSHRSNCKHLQLGFTESKLSEWRHMLRSPNLRNLRRVC